MTIALLRATLIALPGVGWRDACRVRSGSGLLVNTCGDEDVGLGVPSTPTARWATREPEGSLHLRGNPWSIALCLDVMTETVSPCREAAQVSPWPGKEWEWGAVVREDERRKEEHTSVFETCISLSVCVGSFDLRTR